MVKPLWLPIGSVRALLLLALGARGIIDLSLRQTMEPWLIVAIGISAASYFAWRSAITEGGTKRRGVWGLPRGTIRVVFLAATGYGIYLWSSKTGSQVAGVKAFWIVAGYASGLFVHAIVSWKRSPDEAVANYFEHVLALVAILCAGGLVWLAIHPPVDPEVLTSHGWVEPLLAAIVVHYFGSR